MTNTSKPRRHVARTAILTRETAERTITCPECGGTNGYHRLNQPCDFCGFFLNVRLSPDHSKYVRGLGVTASGRDTYDIGDLTADDLRELTPKQVLTATAEKLATYDIETALSVKVGRQFRATGRNWNKTNIRMWLDERYEGRNNGMVRMNCGNLLRGALKRSEGVA